MTTGRDNWRSLQSVMLVTLHVAVVAYVIRTFLRPTSPVASFIVWVPLTIAVAVFLSWPLARGLARAFEPDQGSGDPACPRCGPRAIRPLVRSDCGRFLIASDYRCAGCGTTFRQVGEAVVEEPASSKVGLVDPTGIEFLGEDATVDEIRFLDDRPDSP